MKGLVLEIRDGYAAVLLEDGTVRRVRQNCRVGETIELEARETPLQPKKRGFRWAAAAAAAIVLISVGGTYGYNNAYAFSYVTLDANPSIEYILNRRNQLLSVQPLNDDAQDIADELNAADTRRMTISDALDRTQELLYEEEYLGEDRDNLLLISVSSRGEQQMAELSEQLSDYFQEQDDETLTVYVTGATREEAKEAEALGVSTGRYKLLEDIASREGLTQTELRQFGAAPVGELVSRSGLPERELLFAKTAPDRPEQLSPEGAAPQDGNPASPQEGTAAPQEGSGEPQSGLFQNGPAAPQDGQPAAQTQSEPPQSDGEAPAPGDPSGEPS